MRVCVIGAGFAGLAAATGLVAARVDVTVIEARNRVGGRVWSQPFDPADPDSPVIERGAEFVLAGYDVLREYAAALGLELADTGMSYYVREPVAADGRPAAGVDVSAMRAAGRRLAGLVGDASAADSVDDLLAALDVDPAVADAVRARVEISCAHHSDALAGMVLDHLASMEPLPSHRVHGGNQRIALALAAGLGDRVRLGCAARAIKVDGATVQIRTDGGDVTADRVIVALPLPVLRDLPIEPAVPSWKREVWDRQLMGEAAKLHVELRESDEGTVSGGALGAHAAGPIAASAVMSVPGRFWSWTAADGSGRVRPVLNVFGGSPRALSDLDLAAGPAVWLERVAASRPDLAESFGRALLTTWSDDPWARCAYLAQAVGGGPGDEHAMARPVGPMHFAGEHTAGEWSGLMEGALRSGRRAAAEIMAAQNQEEVS